MFKVKGDITHLFNPATTKKRVPGSTLVETIVSLTILAIVFFICISVALNSMWFSKPNLKLKAFTMTRKVLNESILNADYSNRTYTKQRLTLIKDAEPLSSDLINLNIRVFYNDSVLILETNQLIYPENEGY